MNIRELDEKILSEKKLFSLIEERDIDNLQILLNKVEPKPNINVKDKHGNTPLFFALENNGAAVKTLIEAKADIEAKGNAGLTPLQYAAYERIHVSVIKALIEAKANVEAKDNGGCTALWLAACDRSCEGPADACESDPATVEALIEAKADVGAKDIRGRTALDVTRDKECRKLLKAKMPEKPGWFSDLFKPKKVLHQQSSGGYSKSSDEKSAQHRFS